MNSLKLFTGGVIAAGVLTVWLLPVSLSVKLFIFATLAFSAVFVFVEATGKGKTFAGLTVGALVLYLGLCIQRGVLLLLHPTVPGVLLGIGLIVLPALGAWALIREVLFGLRTQRMAQELEAAGELPVDDLPRSPAGRVAQEAADQEFERYRKLLEAHPTSWKHWYNLSTLYSAAGDRKRARKSMRTAIALKSGKNAVDLTV